LKGYPYAFTRSAVRQKKRNLGHRPPATAESGAATTGSVSNVHVTSEPEPELPRRQAAVEVPGDSSRSALSAVSPATQGEGTGLTFPVSDVEMATEPLPEIACRQAVSQFLGGPAEACSSYQGRLVARVGLHPLLG